MSDFLVNTIMQHGHVASIASDGRLSVASKDSTGMWHVETLPSTWVAVMGWLGY